MPNFWHSLTLVRLTKKILLIITFAAIVFVSAYAVSNTVTPSDTVSITTTPSMPRKTAFDTVSITTTPSMPRKTAFDTIVISEAPSVTVHTSKLVTAFDTVSITTTPSMPRKTAFDTVSITTTPSMPRVTVPTTVQVSESASMPRVTASTTVQVSELTSMPRQTVSTAVPINTLVAIGMTIPSSHQNPILDYSSLLTGSGTVTIQNELDVDVSTLSGHVKVNFPAGTTISGTSSWNGIIDLPTAKPLDSVSFLIQPTIFHPVKKVFEIGAKDIMITTNRAIRLAFVDDGGNQVGFSHGEPVKTITTGCIDDSQTTNDGLPAGGDCNTKVASDLIVWIKHFSSFVVFVTTHGGDYTPGFPPSFNVGFAQNEYPLTINNNTYKLSNYTNTGPLSTIPVGSPFTMKILLYGDYGPSSVQHVSLFTNLRDKQREIQDSDTMISWDATQPLQIVDPNHFFGPITANVTVVNNKLLITLHGTFAKPMLSSDIVIRAWGTDLYSYDTYLLNAWNSVSGGVSALQHEPSSLINGSIIGNTSNQQHTDLQQSSTPGKPDLLQSIKDWGGYSPNQISDSQLLSYFGIHGKGHIPSWVAKNVKWIVTGDVTEQEFTNAIQYLDKIGIIK